MSAPWFSPSSQLPSMDYFLFSLIPFSLITILIIIKLRKSNIYNKHLPPAPPFSLPLIGHLYLIRKPLHLFLARVSSRYGPLLILDFGSRPVLLISSLPIARQCFTSPASDIAFASRPQLPSAKAITYNYMTLASSPYGQHWRNVRRIATLHLLSAQSLQHLSYIRRNESDSLISCLFREYNMESAKFKKVELKSRWFGLAFNVMTRMLVGKRYYGEDGNEEAERFREMAEETLALMGASNVSDFVPVLWWIDFGGVRKKMRSLERKREVIFQGWIDEERRRKERAEEKKGNLMELLLGFQEEDPNTYTNDTIKALIVVSSNFDYSSI